MSNKKCLNCEERHIGCHANCILYQLFKIENDKLKAKLHIDSLIDFRNKRVTKYGK